MFFSWAACVCLLLNFLQVGWRIEGNADFKAHTATFMFSVTWTLYCFISFLCLCNTQVSTSSSVMEDEGLHFYTHRHCLFEVSPFSRIFACLWKRLLSVSSLQVMAKHGFIEKNWKFRINPGLVSQREILLQSNLLLLHWVCIPLKPVILQQQIQYLLQMWLVVTNEKRVSSVISNDVLLWNCVRIGMLLKVLSKVGSLRIFPKILLFLKVLEYRWMIF